MSKKETGKKGKRSKAYGVFHDFGKFLTDIAKLAFGSLVLGTVIDERSESVTVLARA